MTRERQPKAIDRQDAQVNVRVHGNTETAGQSRENVYDEIHDEKTAPKSQVGHTNRISTTLSLQLVYAMKLQCGDWNTSINSYCRHESMESDQSQ